MSAYTIEWLGLLGRWVHLITGIAWIGASFYFVWLDNHLTAPTDAASLQKGVGGELWAVHGGGFYNAQKYRIAPQTLPPSLHWFYWEAYATLLSGFFLLCLLYYAQAEVYLIDPRVAALSKPAAIASSLGFLGGGWLVYDALCRSALARHGAWLGAVLALLLCGAAFGLCHLFSGRGAFIQFGAMLGTIMVANVFFVIIPGQREMVRAKEEGREPDPAAGLRGKLRSVHNTYFTLPVLFTMVSNHYALTFGARYNWMVLIAISAAGVSIRTYFVNRHKSHERGGRTSPWPAVVGLGLLAATAGALAPRTSTPNLSGALAPRTSTPNLSGALAPRTSTPNLSGALAPLEPAPQAAGAGSALAGAAVSPAAEFGAIQQIVAQRCVPCHAEAPSQPGFATAPKGLVLDSREALLTHVALIAPQVETSAMPIGNLTGMTEAERYLLLEWIRHGAPH
jgi:uncharacterized membrane protein